MNETPSGFSRRGFIAGLAAAPALGATAAPAVAQQIPVSAAAQAAATLKDAKGTKLVLLGTGAGPVPGRTRRMTSHAMVSNGAVYVLDCGLGLTDRFAEAGLPPPRVAVEVLSGSAIVCETPVAPAATTRGKQE